VRVADFATVGEMLRFLRRRARLTQRELGLAVGYTESHISRLEGGQRPADVATLAALFVPALGLDREPRLAAQLLDLAGGRRRETGFPVDIPDLPPHAVVREGVLAELRRRLAAERRVAVCGLPGMGKTTLAAMVARGYDADTPVCWFTLTPGVTASADALVRHLAGFLRDLGRAEGRRLLAQRDRDGPLPLDEQLGLLATALDRQPALLCLDNAHLLRADATATAVLAHLAATASTAMLLTAREDVPVPGVGLMRLGGLSRDEAHELIAASGADLAPDLAGRLIGRTGGSPMLLRLALGQLPDRGDPALLVERLENEPRLTAYLLETTLAGLAEPAWRVLSLLAVFRQPVDLHDERLVELGQEADGPYDLAAALDELHRRHLVDHPATATLHPLVHDQVYARMVGDLPRRRRLHRVAATWSRQARGDVLEAAHHLMRAGDLVPAAELLTAHAADLTRRGRALAAADLAGHLLDRWQRDGPELGPLAVRLLGARGDLLADTIRAAEAEDAYRAALAAADGAARPRLAWRLARLLGQRGQPAEAVALCAEAAAGTDPDDRVLRAQLAVTRGQALLPLARYDDAIADANAALDLCDQVVDAPPRTVAEVRARAHATLAQAARIRRRFDDATVHLGRSIEAALAADRPELVNRARYVLANVLLEQGDTTAAEDVYADVLAGCEQVGDSYGVARVLQALTHIHLNRGELARALTTIERSRAIRVQLGSAQAVANADTVRAEVLLTLGRVDEARELIDAVVAGTRETANTWERGYHVAVLAQARLVAGVPEAAVDALVGALAGPGLDGTAVRVLLRAYLAIALYVAGRTEEAHALVEHPGTPVSPGVQLDLYVLDVVRALASGEPDAAMRAIATMADYAEAHDHVRYGAVAADLADAVAAGTPLTGLPRLVWGGGSRRV
jgi:ATP/maltotriose-dependent transcriptional regulator MalT